MKSSAYVNEIRVCFLLLTAAILGIPLRVFKEQVWYIEAAAALLRTVETRAGY